MSLHAGWCMYSNYIHSMWHVLAFFETPLLRHISVRSRKTYICWPKVTMSLSSVVSIKCIDYVLLLDSVLCIIMMWLECMRLSVILHVNASPPEKDTLLENIFLIVWGVNKGIMWTNFDYISQLKSILYYYILIN